MINPNTTTTDRFEVIDALRGFALFGLFSIHMQEHFNLFDFPTAESVWLKTLDEWTNKAMYFLFAGKAYTIFAFLFGISFYIQMKRQAKKGSDFSGRFLWRLAILFVFGFIHGLIYPGDILAFFALLGTALVFLYPLNSTVLWILAALLLLQVPSIFHFFVIAVPSGETESKLYQEMISLYEGSFPVYRSGSFYDLLSYNWYAGKKANWLYMLLYGRVYQTLGLFVLGILLGRNRFFERINENIGLIRKVWMLAIAVFIPLYLLQLNIPEMIATKSIQEFMTLIVTGYVNLAFTAILFFGFILLYQIPSIQKKLNVLKAPGRMSLTNYCMQSLICVPMLFGFGLGLYNQIGFTQSFILGLVIYSLQVIFCNYWLKHHAYGPLEWIWRSATFLTLTGVPLKKRMAE